MRKEDKDELENYGRGVNVLRKNMTKKEKVLEYHRWQNHILACIPDKLTFSELGMEDVWDAFKQLNKLKENEKSSSSSNDSSSGEDDESKEEMSLQK